MKKLFLLFALLASFSLSAQITKNNWLVGGDLYFRSTKAETISSGEIQNQSRGTRLNFNSRIGYFPIDKFAVGLTSRFSYNMPKDRDNTIGFGIGPFVRYYFLKPDKIINLFTHIEYQFSNGFSKGEKLDRSNFFNLKAGPSIFFNSSVALEVTLGYEFSNNIVLRGSSTETKFNSFNIGVGFQIHLEK